MQPGLRRLAEGARQLHPNARDSRHLREKLQALAGPAPAALQCAPGYDPRPGLHALAAQAAAEHPAAFGWDGGTASAQLLGWSVRGGEAAADRPRLAPMRRGRRLPGPTAAGLAPGRRCWRWPSPRTSR